MGVSRCSDLGLYRRNALYCSIAHVTLYSISLVPWYKYVYLNIYDCFRLSSFDISFIELFLNFCGSMEGNYAGILHANARYTSQTYNGYMSRVCDCLKLEEN